MTDSADYWKAVQRIKPPLLRKVQLYLTSGIWHARHC